MRLAVFLLLILGCWGDIQVLIDQTGDYTITVNNRIWLRSSRIAIYVDDQWYSSEDKSLSLSNITIAQGTDPNLGSWNETKFAYNLVGSEKPTSIVAHIRQWHLFSAFTFYLETGDAALTTKIALGNETVRTVFPSFLIEKMDVNDDRGYITVGGLMAGDANKHAGHWNSSSYVIRTPMWDAPVLLFNLTQQGNGDTIVLAPFSHFMATALWQRHETSYTALEYGVTGSMSTIPANFVQSFILFYSSRGINKCVREWGQIMQRAFNRTQKHRLNDLSLNYIGYYMDNGAYYFHNTMPGTNYEDTIINIVNEIKLPIRYMEISAWFYYKGVAGGCSNWSPRPEVLPHGLPTLNRRIGMPFIIHNRYWAYDAIYQKNYSWILDPLTGLSLPASNDSFWLDLLTEAKSWGVILYQQDWLSYEYFLLHQAYTEFNLTNQWLTSMGEAADQVDINLHYIMSYPRHFFKALEVPRVTQIRASGDYAFNLKNPTGSPQWNMGITSMIVDALGLAPNKDVLWSTSVQPDNPYGENAKETVPDRAILMATLSTGPVGIGDAVNLTNVERIMKCCRQDGLILKPDRAITTINVLAADWAHYENVPQGELYSTETTIDNHTFYIVFASAMKRDYSVYPSMIDGISGIVWFYNNTTKISPINDTHPLVVSATRCNDLSVCVWYISPMWQFNDSNKTNYALLGEWNKWTAVSRQRFLSITTNTENTQTIIQIQGVASEIVSVVVYHSTLKSITVNCKISGENDQATLVITPTNAICS